MNQKDFLNKRRIYLTEGKCVSQIHLCSGMSFYEGEIDNIQWLYYHIRFFVKPKNYLNPPEKGYHAIIHRKDIKKIVLR